VLSRGSLTEEGVEGIGFLSNRSVSWHHSVWLDSMLKAIELPARVS
jgi:hypothetical protein